MKQLFEAVRHGLILLALLDRPDRRLSVVLRPEQNASELTPAETLDSLPGLEYLDTHRGHHPPLHDCGEPQRPFGGIRRLRWIRCRALSGTRAGRLTEWAWYNVPYEAYTPLVGLELTRSRDRGDRSASPIQETSGRPVPALLWVLTQAPEDERPRGSPHASYTGLEILDGNYTSHLIPIKRKKTHPMVGP